MKLQEKRKQQGLSQSQLAKKSGVKIRVLQSYEQGKANINTAKLKTLLQLAHALDCSVSDILDDEVLLDMLKQVKLQ